MKLSKNYRFIQLSLKYIDPIYYLVTKHYMIDPDEIMRTCFSKDYLIWCLKYVPKNKAVGLVYKSTLVGMCMALSIDIKLDGKILPTYLGHLLIVHTKKRHQGLSKLLISKISEIVPSILYSHPKESTLLSYSRSDIHYIPINQKKLLHIDFLPEPISYPKIVSRLSILKEIDIPIISTKLNNFLSHLHLSNYFTPETAKQYFLPRKNIIFSFIIKTNNIVTDFISVTQQYFHCLDKDILISNATVTFYFYETVTLTELIYMLIKNLKMYNIDQLCFHDQHQNSLINITKFTSGYQISNYQHNLNVPSLQPQDYHLYMLQ